jgi:hypothetical protein
MEGWLNGQWISPRKGEGMYRRMQRVSLRGIHRANDQKQVLTFELLVQKNVEPEKFVTAKSTLDICFYQAVDVRFAAESRHLTGLRIVLGIHNSYYFWDWRIP